MGYFELEKMRLATMNSLKKKGRLNLHPDYQRDPHAWSDSQRYDLVDTIIREWPSGLIMLRVEKSKDKDGVVIESYDVVDGQQRLTTMFEYIDGTEAWAVKAPLKYQHAGFLPYRQLSEARQSRVDEYLVAVALMKEYDVQDILDIYSRLQTGKPLTIGEKVKAIRSPYKEYIRELAGHKLFNLDRNHWRDQHWNIAAQFFKAAYMDDPLSRVEFPELKSFLVDFKNADLAKAQKAMERANKIMGYESKTIDEAIALQADLESSLSTARMLKWLYATLMRLLDKYAMTGRQHLVARGIIEYLSAKDKEGSVEWTAYTKAGRTGRIDTGDVKVCLDQLIGYIINASKAEPLDPTRWFSHEQRVQIWKKSGEKCATCGLPLSETNFHADHVIAHSQGGQTKAENGQCLCAACNLEKGKDVAFFAG